MANSDGNINVKATPPRPKRGVGDCDMTPTHIIQQFFNRRVRLTDKYYEQRQYLEPFESGYLECLCDFFSAVPELYKMLKE